MMGDNDEQGTHSNGNLVNQFLLVQLKTHGPNDVSSLVECRCLGITCSPTRHIQGEPPLPVLLDERKGMLPFRGRNIPFGVRAAGIGRKSLGDVELGYSCRWEWIGWRRRRRHRAQTRPGALAEYRRLPRQTESGFRAQATPGRLWVDVLICMGRPSQRSCSLDSQRQCAHYISEESGWRMSETRRYQV